MLDPSSLWMFPLLMFRWWVKRLGVKTVLVGMAVVTVLMLLYGWWDSYQ